MIYVPHYGYDRGAVNEFFFAVFLLIKGNITFFFCRDKFYLVVELIGNNGDGFGIQALIDRNEHSQAKAFGNHFVYRYIHQGSKVIGRDKLCQFYYVRGFCSAFVFFFFIFYFGYRLFLGNVATTGIDLCQSSFEAVLYFFLRDFLFLFVFLSVVCSLAFIIIVVAGIIIIIGIGRSVFLLGISAGIGSSFGRICVFFYGYLFLFDAIALFLLVVECIRRGYRLLVFAFFGGIHGQFYFSDYLEAAEGFCLSLDYLFFFDAFYFLHKRFFVFFFYGIFGNHFLCIHYYFFCNREGRWGVLYFCFGFFFCFLSFCFFYFFYFAFYFYFFFLFYFDFCIVFLAFLLCFLCFLFVGCQIYFINNSKPLKLGRFYFFYHYGFFLFDFLRTFLSIIFDKHFFFFRFFFVDFS